jgi:hypothetical protein
MKFSTLLAPLALASALCLSGTSYAATINGVTINDSDVAVFEARCDQLTAESTKSLAESTDDPAAVADAQAPADLSSDEADTLLGGLTLEQCTEAGMTTAMTTGSTSTDADSDGMMIGNMQVPEDQIAALTENCAALRAEQTRSGTTVTNDATATPDTQTSPDPASVENFDMAAVTVEMCTTANL